MTKSVLLLLILVLYGCGTHSPSIEELYTMRAQCVAASAVDCERFDEAITHKEDVIAIKANFAAPKCPANQYAFCDRRWGRCTNDSKGRNRWACVERVNFYGQ